MTTIKKTILTSSDYNLIKDIYENAECYDKKELDNMILDQFDCDTIRDDRLNNNKCPECGNDLELEPYGKVLYEYQGSDESQNLYISICNSCGWTSENT